MRLGVDGVSLVAFACEHYPNVQLAWCRDARTPIETTTMSSPALAAPSAPGIPTLLAAPAMPPAEQRRHRQRLQHQLLQQRQRLSLRRRCHPRSSSVAASARSPGCARKTSGSNCADSAAHNAFNTIRIACAIIVFELCNSSTEDRSHTPNTQHTTHKQPAAPAKRVITQKNSASPPNNQLSASKAPTPSITQHG